MKILYLNWDDMDSLGLSLLEITDGLEKAFVEKGHGRVNNPPKTKLYIDGPDRWFCGMPCHISGLNGAGIKWQSGNPKNAERNLPYILGLYILSAGDGIPLAIMDSTWITAMRTACASALTAKYLAHKEPKTVGIIGCGFQGRTHLEALINISPSISSCKAYDIIPEKTRQFCKEMSQHFNIDVIPTESPRAAVENCDIIVTGGIMTDPPRPGITERGWLSPGTTAITIDYDTYFTADALKDFDHIFTDDMEQTKNSKKHGFFLNANIDCDLGDIIVGKNPGRRNNDERILVFNLGLGIEDLPTAQELYRRATSKGIGTWLNY
jgi:ornithine cyclodeaminase/alanine dehydrogenase